MKLIKIDRTLCGFNSAGMNNQPPETIAEQAVYELCKILRN